jgi:ribonucleoside-diphosphate reductase alpha chain
VWRLADAPRSIAPEGHVDMMAAATCMVSGAISKTVNMPESATVEDIKNIYMRAWKGPRGRCKAIAVYRDGSKGSQPITTAAPKVIESPAPAGESSDGEAGEKVSTKFPGNGRDDEAVWTKEYVDSLRLSQDFPAMVRESTYQPSSGPPITIKETVEVVHENTPKRRKLGVTRNSVTHKFSVAGHEGYIIVGLYGDTMEPGEVFINMSKNGSTVGGLMDALGMMISLGLQYGTPLDKIVEKLAAHRFPPSGVTGDPDIPFATSIIDYIGRWLGCYFIDGYRETVRPMRSDDVTPAAPHGPDAIDDDFLYPTTTEVSSESFKVEFHGNPCPNCGSIMVRQGMCDQCFACGYADGGCGG